MPHYNLLNWWGTGRLRQWIRAGYEEYNECGGLLYVQCWANVMRKGEQILSHKHEHTNNTQSKYHLCGHLSLQVDGSTAVGGSRTASASINVTRVYRIKTLDLDTVRSAVENATSEIYPSGETKPRLSISVDTTTRSLIVTGSPGDVGTAEAIVRQLEAGLKEPLWGFFPAMARSAGAATMVSSLSRKNSLLQKIHHCLNFR